MRRLRNPCRKGPPCHISPGASRKRLIRFIDLPVQSEQAEAEYPEAEASPGLAGEL